MNSTEWKHLNDALRILAGPIAGFMLVQLQRILTQLRLLNGRMMKLETQATAHGLDDDHRFAAIQRDLDQSHELRKAQ